MKILITLAFFLLILGCNSTEKNKKNERIETLIKTEKQVDSKIEDENTVLVETGQLEVSKTETLKERIDGLHSGCLGLPIDSIYRKIQFEKIVDRNTEKWLFGLEKNDSSQFERADLIRPICKLNENRNILSVIFSDQYDYKTAIHIFNFRKSDFKPVSSFIIHSKGGDAEDFWTTKYIKSDNWTYEITEIIGRYNDSETKDTTFIELIKTKSISINESTGKITTEEIKIERNLIITE